MMRHTAITCPRHYYGAPLLRFTFRLPLLPLLIAMPPAMLMLMPLRR
jgi:hypothetical protein